ncbi:MAG: hypothetical protein WCX75_03085 [Fibrobacteraceae bacterium]
MTERIVLLKILQIHFADTEMNSFTKRLIRLVVVVDHGFVQTLADDVRVRYTIDIF